MFVYSIKLNNIVTSLRKIKIHVVVNHVCECVRMYDYVCDQFTKEEMGDLIIHVQPM
jgi:hypothetical protein